ncbi:hypothetical protein BDR07DRAFT_1378900 [Suillus spraguei]|nr:hypothetical protein BDR07DRAFT_1378900 [Suillus spraguei]
MFYRVWGLFVVNTVRVFGLYRYSTIAQPLPSLLVNVIHYSATECYGALRSTIQPADDLAKDLISEAVIFAVRSHTFQITASKLRRRPASTSCTLQGICVAVALGLNIATIDSGTTEEATEDSRTSEPSLCDLGTAEHSSYAGTTEPYLIRPQQLRHFCKSISIKLRESYGHCLLKAMMLSGEVALTLELQGAWMNTAVYDEIPINSEEVQKILLIRREEMKTDALKKGKAQQATALLSYYMYSVMRSLEETVRYCDAIWS